MVKIRLRREGTKGRPYYRVVVADQRARRDGRFLEIIGRYDPLEEKDGNQCTLDLEALDKWVGNGAQMSDTVKSLAKKARATAA
ncbi:MAG: 30S ribosomal protein S16 [Verrucomicrobiales bacterium]